MTIEISNESGEDVDESSLAGLTRYLLDEMGVSPLAELSVLMVDVDTMASLNERWMGESGPTDVLAFPMDELDMRGPEDVQQRAPALLGDVVLCPSVAHQQAKVANHTTQHELQLLCTHGVLHLLGYDHAEPDQEREMFGLQARLLQSWQGRSHSAQTEDSEGSTP